MYTGKEICQGCKKPGTEITRYTKTSLCSICEKALKLGLKAQVENNIKYIRIRQHLHAYYADIINPILHDLLKALDNPNAEFSGFDSIKHYFGDNCRTYTINKAFLKPIKDFCNQLENFYTEVKEEKEKIPKEAKEEVQKEKNKIFNDGIKKGRDLLIQLNAGEISIKDFEKSFVYYK